MALQTGILSTHSPDNGEETSDRDTLTIVVYCDSESAIENEHRGLNSNQCSPNPPTQPDTAPSSSPSKSSFHRIASYQLKTLMLILTILALVISSVSLWPSVSSANDAKRATLLAQWEAEKDFLEFCESVGFYFFLSLSGG